MKVTPGAPAQEVVPPSGGSLLPDGLAEAVKTAAKFIGKYSKKLPHGQFVHIVDGKAYASNNRHIVEVEVGQTPFASLRLSRNDIALLTRIGGNPARASISGGHAEFTWADGQWIRIEVGDASEAFVERCRQRLEKYWDEPQGMPINPKSVDLVVKRAKKGQAVSIAVIGHRVIGMDDGFFYPHNATTAAVIQKRKFDPMRDDLFAEALAQTKRSKEQNDSKVERLKKRLRAIGDEIDELAVVGAELDEKWTAQHDAIEAYQNGGSLDEDQRALLTPQCSELVKDERRNALDAEFEQHEGSIPEGWEITGKRQDDDFIYVTIRRERVTKSQPEETAASKIKKALAQFFKPGFDRDFRVRWDQLGTLSPIVRGAP
ncbi:MAG: hypothetical protein JXR15_13280 [Shimia sp.]|uniref:hypothetical protein n=1 Tax=Shimia sp. TaxID=1954381 RepID=UPI003B8B332B